MSLLEARGLICHFGGVKAIDGVDFDLEPGEIHALIGPNGAGKSTLVGLLSGRIPVQAGSIRFDGRDITHLPAHARVACGIAYMLSGYFGIYRSQKILYSKTRPEFINIQAK